MIDRSVIQSHVQRSLGLLPCNMDNVPMPNRFLVEGWGSRQVSLVAVPLVLEAKEDFWMMYTL